AVILSTDDETAIRRFCEEADQRLSEISASGACPITISCGSSVCSPERRNQIPLIMEEADKQMYEVKRSKKAETQQIA
ncbi:MAG: diguanylate cyclase, partial [Eubacteriales bacterium]|nr:diguanylate cyclase [Eubacteriales bacterium]